MHVVIMGSGRTGSRLARKLAREGHHVAVIDWEEDAFQRLGEEFEGDTIVGNAIDGEVLRQAGIEAADVFVAATSGDNRNIMASEVARDRFHVPRVICRVKDPNRARLFGAMGIRVDCRTIEGANALLEMIGVPDRVFC
jgi:trk system potassium uptake protein TrkA